MVGHIDDRLVNIVDDENIVFIILLFGIGVVKGAVAERLHTVINGNARSSRQSFDDAGDRVGGVFNGTNLLVGNELESMGLVITATPV